jgi:hypothetical protein
MLHVCNIIHSTVTRVQYNKTHCYVCTIRYKVLLHVYNTKQYYELLHVYNTIQCTVTRVQYNTRHCYACTIQGTVTRVQNNTMHCYTCTIKYKVLLQVYNTIQGTVPRVQTLVGFIFLSKPYVVLYIEWYV